jgi:Ca2+-binding EF-hand superfamily protein
MLKAMCLILTLGWLVGACAATTPEPQTGGNFSSLCRNVDTNLDGKISREELLASAKDKEEAAAIFDLCDVKRTGAITYDEAARDNRLQEVIRLTTPSR